MRKNFGPKFWSQGTYLGCPRALGGTPGVVAKFRLVILFTYMMVYIPILFTSLGYFFRLTSASVEMWYVDICGLRMVYVYFHQNQAIYRCHLLVIFTPFLVIRGSICPLLHTIWRLSIFWKPEALTRLLGSTWIGGTGWSKKSLVASLAA